MNVNYIVVRSGYNQIAEQYLASREIDQNHRSFLEQFAGLLPSGGKVLDAGCGAGVPITRWLSERFTVTGVDLSDEQIRLARRLVPGATFIREDMTRLAFGPGSFDGICSLYAIIHVPREDHAPLLRNFHRMLKPGGVVLLCMGAGDSPGIVEDFFGAPMYWSHYDAEINLRLVEEAGFELIRSDFVPDGLYAETTARHLFVLAAKRHLLGE